MFVVYIVEPGYNDIQGIEADGVKSELKLHVVYPLLKNKNIKARF